MFKNVVVKEKNNSYPKAMRTSSNGLDIDDTIGIVTAIENVTHHPKCCLHFNPQHHKLFDCKLSSMSEHLK